MEAGPSFHTNLNTEMSDLVHLAEEWATEDRGSSRIQRIGRSILARAAMILLEQMGITTVEAFENKFGKLKKTKQDTAESIEVRRESKAVSPVSPMAADEFQSILKNGWPELLDQPLSMSPFPTRRRTSLLADLIPMSPIASEDSQMSPKKKRTSTASIEISKKMLPMLQTPMRRRTNSMPDSFTTNRQTRRESMMLTPKRTSSSPRVSLIPAGETPLENRASRLRKAKLEEKLGLNNSFGYLI